MAPVSGRPRDYSAALSGDNRVACPPLFEDEACILSTSSALNLCISQVPLALKTKAGEPTACGVNAAKRQNECSRINSGKRHRKLQRRLAPAPPRRMAKVSVRSGRSLQGDKSLERREMAFPCSQDIKFKLRDEPLLRFEEIAKKVWTAVRRGLWPASSSADLLHL